MHAYAYFLNGKALSLTLESLLFLFQPKNHVFYSESVMANPILVSESTLTDRYQTTVPGPVRKALHLQ